MYCLGLLYTVGLKLLAGYWTLACHGVDILKQPQELLNNTLLSPNLYFNCPQRPVTRIVILLHCNYAFQHNVLLLCLEVQLVDSFFRDYIWFCVFLLDLSCVDVLTLLPLIFLSVQKDFMCWKYHSMILTVNAIFRSCRQPIHASFSQTITGDMPC